MSLRAALEVSLARGCSRKENRTSVLGKEIVRDEG
jgi:hypothetical protein